MKMNYYKSKENQVYAYTNEDIAKTEQLSELEARHDNKKEKLIESESQLNISKEKYAKSNDELYQLAATESDESEIAIAKEKLIAASIELEKSLSDFNVAEQEYREVKSELDSIQHVFYVIRENIETMKKMTAKEVDAHINPPIPKEQLIAEAEMQKQLCAEDAEKNITILERKVRLGMATDDDKNSLTVWEIYSINVADIDTSTAPDITWPVKP